MKLIALLFPASLLLAGAGAVPASEVLASAAIGERYDELLTEFENTVEQWNVDQQGASKEERSVLRKHKPAATYWDRFAALSATGDGQAKLWMITHVRAAGIKSRQRAKTLTPLYRTLVAEHSASEWFGEVLTRIARDKRVLGDELSLALYATVITNSESDESRAGALFGAGSLLKDSEEAKARERGEAYHARLEADFGQTTWAAKLRDMRATERVQVGKVAPDFEAKTIDGFDFNLADYRGKVVMLDFYGFW